MLLSLLHTVLLLPVAHTRCLVVKATACLSAKEASEKGHSLRREELENWIVGRGEIGGAYCACGGELQLASTLCLPPGPYCLGGYQASDPGGVLTCGDRRNHRGT